MRLAAVATFLLVGCGRFGFEPIAATTGDGGTDATGEHDEDGDGFADRVDVCPHLANDDQRDQDGDGVGDACDREPTIGRQTLTYFNAMRPIDEPLLISGGGIWTQRTDGREFNGGGGAGGRNGQLTKIIPLGDADIWIGVSILSRNPGAVGYQIGLALLDVSDTAQYYYGQFYEDAGSAEVTMSEWTGPTGAPPNTYLTRAMQVLATGVHTGRAQLLVATHRSTQLIDAIGGWGAESYVTMGFAPVYDGADRLTLTTEGLVFELEYLAIVTTQ